MNTAFIGLDYIIDITHPNGKIARCASQIIARNTIQHANSALSLSRQKGWLNILVAVGFQHGYQEQPKHSKIFGRAHELGALTFGTLGTQFHPDLDVQDTDFIVQKPRVSAFYCTALDAVLRANKIERVIIAGVSSTWAVQATARDAHDRDYQILILEEACADVTQEAHQQSMNTLAGIAEIIHLTEMAQL